MFRNPKGKAVAGRLKPVKRQEQANQPRWANTREKEKVSNRSGVRRGLLQSAEGAKGVATGKPAKVGKVTGAGKPAKAGTAIDAGKLTATGKATAKGKPFKGSISICQRNGSNKVAAVNFQQGRHIQGSQ